MPYNEADTRAKLIDPAIHKCGWTEDLIRREETAGTVEIINGKARRRSRGKIDYVLRVKVNVDTQPVALALIEAKKESLPAGHGLDQAKGYSECKRLNVRFVFSSNGHQFVEFDCFTGLTAAPKPIAEFPSPAELRARYEQGMGFTLESPAARPLLQPYAGGEGTRRYYQDAAIRAVMEKLAKCEGTGEPTRALLAMATGCGKTFIAVNLLKRISDAGHPSARPRAGHVPGPVQLPPGDRRPGAEDHHLLRPRPPRRRCGCLHEQPLRQVVHRQRQAASGLLHIQMHRSQQRQRPASRSPCFFPQPLHRRHGRSADDRCGRAMRAEHRLFQIPEVAHQLLPDGRPGHTYRRAYYCRASSGFPEVEAETAGDSSVVSRSKTQ